MAPNERARKYIEKNWRTHTLADLARACRVTTARVFLICRSMGITPVSVSEKKANIIRAFEGRKTIDQLVDILDCHISTVRRICREYELPYKPVEAEKAPPVKAPVGRPRTIYVPPDPPRKPIQRPPATYSNQNRDQLIEKVLND